MKKVLFHLTFTRLLMLMSACQTPMTEAPAPVRETEAPAPVRDRVQRIATRILPAVCQI